jgi:hypothetical protein
MKNLIIKGNSKMGPKVGIFNLPPKKTCTPSKWCLQGKNGKPACYGLRNNCQLPSVVKATEWRFQESMKPDFALRMIKEINGKYDYIRLHSTGDFYSCEYLSKWYDIIKALPKVKFRTTSRRKDYSLDLRTLASLPNMIIRESLDPTSPTPRMLLPTASITGMEISKGKFKCPNGCVECKYSCWKSRKSICFDEH